jgi:hypothetical protein
MGPLGPMFEGFGAVKASPMAAARLLRQGEAVLLFPGGAREVRTLLAGLRALKVDLLKATCLTSPEVCPCHVHCALEPLCKDMDGSVALSGQVWSSGRISRDCTSAVQLSSHGKGSTQI